jgi:endonuclease IV
MVLLSRWAPAAVKEMEGKGGADRVDSAQGIRPHMSYLMRDNTHAPSSHKFSPSFKVLFSAIKVSPLFGSPNLHPDSSSAPSCTQENPLINPGPLIDQFSFSN